jgi:hypothetical protein
VETDAPERPLIGAGTGWTRIGDGTVGCGRARPDGAAPRHARPVSDRQVLRRRDLRSRGWDDAAISRELRAGRLARVHRDRYVSPGAVLSIEQIVARPGTSTALSHASAARAWGLPSADPRVHVTIPHGCRRRALGADTVVHQTRTWQPVVRGGVVVTDPTRTVADLLRTDDLGAAVAAADAALRSGLVEVGPLATELCAAARSNLRARRALALTDGRSESPLESQLRLILVLDGVPPDELQREVREAGAFVARVDLWYDAGLIVEADGFEFHRARADYVADRRKAQAYARLGLSLLRFSWEDVQLRPDVVVATVRVVLARRGSAVS